MRERGAERVEGVVENPARERGVERLDDVFVGVDGGFDELGEQHRVVFGDFRAERLGELPDALQHARTEVQIRLAEPVLQHRHRIAHRFIIHDSELLLHQRGQIQHGLLPSLPAVLPVHVLHRAQQRTHLARQIRRLHQIRERDRRSRRAGLGLTRSPAGGRAGEGLRAGWAGGSVAVGEVRIERRLVETGHHGFEEQIVEAALLDEGAHDVSELAMQRADQLDALLLHFGIRAQQTLLPLHIAQKTLQIDRRGAKGAHQLLEERKDGDLLRGNPGILHAHDECADDHVGTNAFGAEEKHTANIG